ncbi:MAG TPA: hypothetical protein PKA63_11130 [Oligoflexia bacterium]|nr:hypothetical protein [Oligoflexia bacterium]HMP49211.1 hypothetical protein [Oligoflexia bacterium]
MADIVQNMSSLSFLSETLGKTRPEFSLVLPGVSLILPKYAKEGPGVNERSEDIGERIFGMNLPLQVKTERFEVHCRDEKLAKSISEYAEKIYGELAEKLGANLTDGSSTKIQLHAELMNLSGGLTSSVFYKDMVDRPLLNENEKLADRLVDYEKYYYQISDVKELKVAVFGSEERMLNSTLPHEITHALMSQICKSFPPIWLNEGVACFNEEEKTRNDSIRKCFEAISKGESISLREVFNTYSYPENSADIWKYYDQSTLVSEFLIRNKGLKEFVELGIDICLSKSVRPYMKDSALSEDALRKRYGYANIEKLEEDLHKWIKKGCPRIVSDDQDFKNTLPDEYRVRTK